MEGLIYDCINHIKCVSKKKPNFEKNLASISKLDMIENQLLELSDNVYKIKEKDSIESAFPEISEIETLVINETQMTREKAVNIEVIGKQMVKSIESPTISNNDVQSLPDDIYQLVDWKKIINVVEDSFTKIKDVLIGLKAQQFSLKNESGLDNIRNSERDLVVDT